MRRAVITGIGLVTPVGIGKDAFWSGIRSGRSAVQQLTRFDASPYNSKIAAEIRNFDPNDFLAEKRAERYSRYAQLGVASARLAVDDAGLDLNSVHRARLGVAIGSAFGGLASTDEHYTALRQLNPRVVDMELAGVMFSRSGCAVALELGATGPVSSNSNSCASGTMAIGDALGFIRRGEANIMLAGGAEAPLFPLCFGAFAHSRALSCRNNDPEHASRPFDARRDGFVMSEGAAVLVLEEFHHALNRGARIYGEIVGYGVTNDAYHLTDPLPDGAQAARAIRLAIDQADLKPENIDYINAHGISSPVGDKTETLAIKSVFGDRARFVTISSTKGHLGHAMGATGAIEAAICALAMERAFVPPTINYECPDPDCDLDYTPNSGRAHDIHALITNSFGFGGINACLAMRKVTF